MDQVRVGESLSGSQLSYCIIPSPGAQGSLGDMATMWPWHGSFSRGLVCAQNGEHVHVQVYHVHMCKGSEFTCVTACVFTHVMSWHECLCCLSQLV